MDDTTPSAGADARMVSGAAISNFIFFEMSGLTREAGFITAALRPLRRQEIWLESTGDRLENLAGDLRIAEFASPNIGASGRISRQSSGYTVELWLSREDYLQALARSAGALLTLVFDVEYREGYESPGGYSDDFGVRYWDDVLYPIAACTRFSIE